MPPSRTLDPDAARVLRRISRLAAGAPQPDDSRQSISRGTVVIGKMAEALSDRYHAEAGKAHSFEKAKKASLSWFAWLFHMFWGVVELLVPRSALVLIFQYWISFVLALGILLVVLTTLFASVTGVHEVAAGAVGVAMAAGLLSGLVRRYARKRSRVIPAAIVFLLLSAAFAARLYTGDSRFDPWIPFAFLAWAATGGSWLSLRARSWLPRPHVSAMLAIATGAVTCFLTIASRRDPESILHKYVLAGYVVTACIVLIPGALGLAYWLQWRRQDAQLAKFDPGNGTQRAANGCAPPPASDEPPEPRTPTVLSREATIVVQRVAMLAAPPPQRLPCLYLFARTLSVMGSMFQEYFSHNLTAARPGAIWMGRAGFLLKQVTRAADPSSLGTIFFHHWFWLAFALASVLSVLTRIFGSSGGLTRGAAILWTITGVAGLIVGAVEIFSSHKRFRTCLPPAIVALGMGILFLFGQ